MDLGDLKEIAKLDKEKMLDMLIRFPKQCHDALFIGERIDITKPYKRDYRNIVFTGVGGSAIGADIVKDYASSEVGIPILVNRDYVLPQSVDERTLLFAVSYSGNTEETLSAYVDGKKRRAKVIAITSGGRLKELAIENRDILITVPKGYPPRCALGYSFIPAVMALSRLGLINNKTREIKGAIQLMEGMVRRSLAPSVRGKTNAAKSIAKIVHNKFPVIYASSKIGSVAMRWRGQFAENAKALSSSHLFPEMNHNEIVGWQYPRALLKHFTAIILRDRGDHARVKRRMEITKSILKKGKFDVLEVESHGKALLERMLSLVYIGDFASFYLALLNRIDPTPVERIVYLKKQLAE